MWNLIEDRQHHASVNCVINSTIHLVVSLAKVVEASPSTLERTNHTWPFSMASKIGSHSARVECLDINQILSLATFLHCLVKHASEHKVVGLGTAVNRPVG